MKYSVVFGCATMDIAHYEKTGENLISFGGKGANQAIALSKAGIKTIILTKLSGLKEEKDTKNIIKNFKKNKVITKYIDFDNYRNDYTKVTISKNGNNKLDEFWELSQHIDEDYVLKNKDIIENAKFALIQLKVPIKSTLSFIEICKKAKVKVVLTPCRTQKAKDNFEVIEKADFITCNEKEVKEIFGNDGKLSSKELDSVLKKYPNKLIVTLGGKGVKFFDGQKVQMIKALNIENVIDTTGAGDTFCGNFVSALMDGQPIIEAIKKGICASSIKIQTHGTQNGIPKKKERDKLYNQIFKTSKGENND